MQKFSVRRGGVALVATLSVVGVAFLAGCGGSNGGGNTTPVTRSTVPTQQTKNRVQSLLNFAQRGLTTNGAVGNAFVVSRNSIGGSGSGAGVTAAAPGVAGGGGNVVPLIGSFLKNVAATSHMTRAVHLRRLTRDVAPGPPVNPSEVSSFYYDYYLGLWVQITDTATSSTYTLYSDEAKTQPAGSIVTSQPADYNTYPQVYQSSYSFTSGYLSGSNGSSINHINSDGGGSSSYNDTYADGSKDSGASSWSGLGDSSWTSRTDATDKSWTVSRGGFRADGNGGSHYETSDGYVADYVYNSDGSGHSSITGPDPGLPVTTTWDAFGNTTIRYADGSTETIPGWNYYGGFTGAGTNGGGGDVVPVSTPAATPAPPPASK